MAFKVKVHGAGESVGNHQRWARQVVHFHIGVDSTLEVAVTREHRGHSEVVVIDGLGDFIGQWPRVSNTGGAAVAHEVEAELLQVVHQPGFLVIVGDDFGSRGEGGLDPWLGLQPLLGSVASEKTRCEHHRGV